MVRDALRQPPHAVVVQALLLVQVAQLGQLKQHLLLHMIHAVRVQVLQQGLERRARGAVDADLFGVALAEAVRVEHRSEVRTPSGQNVAVRGDPLLLHHE
eukprot:1191826-Prorocentrum_minimum.AAC.2